MLRVFQISLGLFGIWLITLWFAAATGLLGWLWLALLGGLLAYGLLRLQLAVRLFALTLVIGGWLVCQLVSIVLGGLLIGTFEPYDIFILYVFLVLVLPTIFASLWIAYALQLWAQRRLIVLAPFNFAQNWLVWTTGVAFIASLIFTPIHNSYPLQFTWRGKILAEHQARFLAGLPRVNLPFYVFPDGELVASLERNGVWYQANYSTRLNPYFGSIFYQPKTNCPDPQNKSSIPTLDVAIVPGKRVGFSTKVSGNTVAFPFAVKEVEVPQGGIWKRVGTCVQTIRLEPLPKQIRVKIWDGSFLNSYVLDTKTGGASNIAVLDAKGGKLSLIEGSFIVPAGVLRYPSEFQIVRLPERSKPPHPLLEVVSDTFRIESSQPIPFEATFSLDLDFGSQPQSVSARPFIVITPLSGKSRIEVAQEEFITLPFYAGVSTQFTSSSRGWEVFVAIRKMQGKNLNDVRVACDFSPANHQSAECACLERKGWPQDTRQRLFCSREGGKITEQFYRERLEQLR